MDYHIIYFGSMIIFFTLFMTLFFLSRTNRRGQRLNKLDTVFILFIIVSALDAIWIFIDGVPQYRIGNIILEIIYLSVMSLTGYTWFLYTLEMFPSGSDTLRKYRYVLMAPVVFEIICILLSVRTGWVFSVDEQGMYSRGPYHIYTVILNYLYIMLGSIVALRSRREAVLILDKKRFTVAAMFPLPVLVLSAAQMMLPPGLPTMEGGVVIGLLMLYGVSQSSMITRDYLTGLPNRFAFEQELQEHIRMQHRSRGLQLYLMEGDLDNFKEINDTYGHPVGDEAIILAADVLSKFFHMCGTAVFRTGGDEFMMISAVQGDIDIDIMRRELNNALSDVHTREGFNLSISLGYTKYEDGMRPHELIEKVDQSLYAAKGVK